MILFHDVDGCLNTAGGEPLGETLSSDQRFALARLGEAIDASAFTHLILNTGRCLEECRPIVEAITTAKLRYVVLEHGSVLLDTHDGVALDLQTVAAKANRRDVLLKLETVERVRHLRQWFEDAGRWLLADALAVAEPFEWIRPKLGNLTVEVPENFDGVAAMAALREVVAASPEFAGDRFTWHYSASERFIDVMGDVDKGTGVMLACDHLGVDVRTTVGIGNGLNDMAMLEAVGKPLCPANSEPEVKALCESRAGVCLTEGWIDATIAWLATS